MQPNPIIGPSDLGFIKQKFLEVNTHFEFIQISMKIIIKCSKKFEMKFQNSKKNYMGLKLKLGKLIHDEVAKQAEGNEEMKTALLNQIVPGPGRKNSLLRGKRALPKKNLQ